jgi:hypothetical protein
MKLGISKFGFSISEKTSSRNVETTPILRVLGGTVTGKHRLNGLGSELLNVAPGDYICFFDNAATIREAIAAKDEDLMAWAEENNCKPSDYPVTFAIARGFQLFEEDGKPSLKKEKISKAEKEALIEQGQVDEEGNVIVPLSLAFYGSKVATTTDSTAVGNVVSFSESVKWAKLRNGAADDEHTAWTLDTVNVMTVEVDNGYETVEVEAWPLINPTIESMSVKG